MSGHTATQTWYNKRSHRYLNNMLEIISGHMLLTRQIMSGHTAETRCVEIGHFLFSILPAVSGAGPCTMPWFLQPCGPPFGATRHGAAIGVGGSSRAHRHRTSQCWGHCLCMDFIMHYTFFSALLLNALKKSSLKTLPRHGAVELQGMELQPSHGLLADWA